ncbi:MAG: peptidylprolyl isomerase [Methanobrevibacter sp.]|jgi:peptidylprolyl isomerase/FKBP-type peptidyl-prolyl cis-trans isomerase SlyD|nr:peptidylprolyl isomerase [Methanobrevibacter sp.]
MIKKGDFIRVDLTSKIKKTGEIFETTYENVAKEAGIYDEKKIYVPMPVVVYGGHFLEFIDESLIDMGEGDSKHIEVLPKDGYGERNPKLINLIPLNEFKKANINPIAGMIITYDHKKGKILSVSGGRVKVDFNNIFAGKTLEYDLNVVEIIKDDKEKIKSMIELHYPQYPKFDLEKTEVKINGKTVSIELDKTANVNNNQTQLAITQSKFRTSQDIWKNMDVEKIEFIESFKKPSEKKASEDNKEVLEDNKETSNDDKKTSSSQKSTE